jgi:hypothetical protein
MQRSNHRSGEYFGIIPAAYEDRRWGAAIQLLSYLLGRDIHAGSQLL